MIMVNLVFVELALKEDRECSLHWHNVFQAVLYILLNIVSTRINKQPYMIEH